MIISRAPLRVSFFGGGTDYPEHFLKEGGAVLATAIDRFCYVTASPFQSRLFDYSIRVSYRKGELVKRVSDIKHAVYRECLRQCGIERDIELHNVADLPAFTGLGSSSSFTVSLLQALHAFKGEFLAPIDIAYEAIRVERGRLRESVGCQDQVLAAVGGFNAVEFRREDDIRVHRVPLSPVRMREFERHLLLVFTGQKRKASEIVRHQMRKVSRNAATLRRMRSMVDQGWDILAGGRSLTAFGALLHEAWMAKHSLDPRVSSPRIDALYARGRRAGALGGKLLGAGGGGFLLFFAPPEAHARLARSFSGSQVLSPAVDAPGSQVIFASPAGSGGTARGRG
ncbi:MAG: GHMP kinase [Elusimicrobia bacterium]|nr:GHMP kinase [Elusimicrobiota bacterium]